LAQRVDPIRQSRRILKWPRRAKRQTRGTFGAGARHGEALRSSGSSAWPHNEKPALFIRRKAEKLANHVSPRSLAPSLALYFGE
jgi:hypothetical protein